MQLVQLCIVLGATFCVGSSIVLKLGIKDEKELFSLGWLVGLPVITWLWFLQYFVFSISFSIQSLLFLSMLVLVFCARSIQSLFSVMCKNRCAHVKMKSGEFFKVFSSSYVIRYLCCCLIFFMGFVFFQDIFWPVTDWDALALYDFRAKVIVATGTLDQGVELGYFFQYPLFTSLLHSISYLFQVNQVKVWYAFLYITFIFSFYNALRKNTHREVALFGSLFLASTPLFFTHSMMAYTNLAYTAYTSLGFIYMWLWFESKNSRDLYVGSVLIGLGTWVRISEPFYYIAFMLACVGFVLSIYKTLSITQQHLKQFVLSSITIFSIRYPWDLLITQMFSKNVNTPLASFSLVSHWDASIFFSRLIEVCVYLFKFSWPVYGIYLLIAMVLWIKEYKNNKNFIFSQILTIVLILLVIVVGTYITSLWLESWNRIGDSVARMSMVVIPLCIYSIFASPVWKKVLKKDSHV